MEIFSIDFTPNELSFIRQALDLATIKGSDAKFLASLQMKLENELIEIQKILENEELKKQEELKKIISKNSKSKSE